MWNWIQHLFTARALEQENLSLQAQLAKAEENIKQLYMTIEQLRKRNAQDEREKSDLREQLNACLEQNDRKAPLEPEFT